MRRKGGELELIQKVKGGGGVGAKLTLCFGTGQRWTEWPEQLL